MDNIQVIVECTMNDERELLISRLGKLKYRLPIINSYVVEIPADSYEVLSGLEGIKAVHKNNCITAQMNVARKAVSADKVQSKGVTGRGITIAVLDTGVAPVDDLVLPKNRIIAFKDFVNGETEPYDDNCHGTHVAGIAAGNGYRSKGKYMGISPEANIVAVKILDDEGKGNAGDVLAGIQWIVDNKERYNIRVANLSIGTDDIGSKDPLVRAVEAAWDAGIVMTIAAGNNGPSPNTVTSPGISRKVITVGASDDNKTVTIWGDTLQNFSGRGPTGECIVKPDIIAPGSDIVSCLSSSVSISSMEAKKLKIVDKFYTQMSGTSMSTPIVAGAVASLLQRKPNLTPDQVKLKLKYSTVSLNYSQNQQGWGLLNVERFVLS